MAVIFPDTPLSAASPEVARVHRLLKGLPDETYAVWHRLSIHTEPGPDFWIRDREGRSVWLKVSTLSPAEARVFGQAGLFEQNATRPLEPEQRVLVGFAAAHLPANAQVMLAVALPNLEAAEVERLRPLADIPPGVVWVGKEQLKAQAFTAWLADHLGQPLTDDALTQIRLAFTPEVRIPASFTARGQAAGAGARKTTAQLTPMLLDYDQEQALKTDLDLPIEARAAVGDFRVRLVNGVAGSGKSLLIVYRAQLLRRLYPHKTILGLTHNRPLIYDLETRYRAVAGDGPRVDWLTFYQWCRRLWPAGREFREPIGHDAKRRILDDICQVHFADGWLGTQTFQDELDWCKDRLIFTRDEYLAADRAGRGFALTTPQRQLVYTAFETYQHQLNQREQMDWGDVPRQIWRWMQTGVLRLPSYDVILVDEAQFFAPLWFEIIKRAVKPGHGHLFLVADPTQGFLKRRGSWLASGLEVRGRVHSLKRSYRTTREILSFATLLYRTRLPDDDDDIVAPDLLNMPAGVVPQLISLSSAQDEATRIVAEIEQLLAQGVPGAHILVVHAGWRGRDQLLERLRQRLGPQGAVDPGLGPAGGAVRVCTLNTATGLESPIVFLAGVHELFEQEHSLRLSDAERRELVRDNTRKLYMAATRAGQRLVLTCVGEWGADLVTLIG